MTYGDRVRLKQKAMSKDSPYLQRLTDVPRVKKPALRKYKPSMQLQVIRPEIVPVKQVKS